MYKKIMIVFITFLLIFSCPNIFAHSGKTDKNGGHKDNKNVSGLGNYHYHCGGYSAHLHTNGICPYSNNTSNTLNTNTNTTNNTKSVKNEIVNNVPDKIEVESINFTSSNLTLEVNKEMKITYLISPTNATDKTVKFTVDNKDILEVNNDGIIKGKKVGKAIVIATTSNEKSATLIVEVISYPESIKINSIENKEYYIGDCINLSYEILPDYASRNITWSSNNNNIANVDSNGKVNCLAEGEVIITVKDVNGKSDSVKLKINKKQEERISLIPLLLFEGIIGAAIPLILRKS